MDRRNKHLESEERGVIFAGHDRGSSQRALGRLLGRSASTRCRELALDWVRDGLVAGGMLREVEVTAAMPKMRPWLARAHTAL
jgi:IS30 family transposase